ncbi:hypothetical protein GCM10027317_21520 [Massilia agri]
MELDDMKKLILAAVASTLLGGCAHEPSTSRESRARDDDYVSVGSHLKRKKGQASTSRTSTGNAADVEEAKMQ